MNSLNNKNLLLHNKIQFNPIIFDNVNNQANISNNNDIKIPFSNYYPFPINFTRIMFNNMNFNSTNYLSYLKGLYNTNFNNNSDFYINKLSILYKNNGNGKQCKIKPITDKKCKIKTKEENEEKMNKYKAKPENLINISLIMLGKEKRTFVRLHPIPKNLSVYDMVKIIDKYLKTKPGQRIYNAVYLPLTKIIGKNMGYFFVNLVNPKYVVKFYNIFNGFYFRFKKSSKPSYVIFSDIQEINLSNGDDPRRKPLIFNDTIKE